MPDVPPVPVVSDGIAMLDVSAIVDNTLHGAGDGTMTSGLRPDPPMMVAPGAGGGASPNANPMLGVGIVPITGSVEVGPAPESALGSGTLPDGLLGSGPLPVGVHMPVVIDVPKGEAIGSDPPVDVAVDDIPVIDMVPVVSAVAVDATSATPVAGQVKIAPMLPIDVALKIPRLGKMAPNGLTVVVTVGIVPGAPVGIVPGALGVIEPDIVVGDVMPIVGDVRMAIAGVVRGGMDVICAKLVPQPNKTAVAVVRSNRRIETSCVAPTDGDRPMSISR